MTANDNGGPAFPRPAVCGDGFTAYEEAVGMTLRDWFAGQAMAGLLAYPGAGEWASPDKLAVNVYRYADAMLEARK